MLGVLALTSRVLDAPLNLAFVAASGSGKSFAIQTALRLAPVDAYIYLSSASPTALIHSKESFQHRMLVLGEADSIPEHGSAAAAIRSIVSDREMVVEHTRHDPVTGQLGTHTIHKPGPTGLMTSTTRPLPTQLSTRTLSIPIAQTPAMTRAILLAQAGGAQAVAAVPADLDRLRGTPDVGRARG